MSDQAIRTRIAPSPTGTLHVGTARSALYNELFARQHGGHFIVRIEDTDPERSRSEFEHNILEGLAWLGLTWDEGPDVGGSFGPYRQSERREGYRQAIARLLENDAAYRVEGGDAIKLRAPDEEIVFTDLIRGEVRLHPRSWGGDFVIARNEGSPVFHLAVVVDDAAQHITHVIRGEDHVSNTARHILLQRALGVPSPHYAHLPLLLDEQRRKLSKRAGEVSLLAYRERGYLPAALLNYLALLGWNPGDDREIFSHDELVKEFSLERVQKGGAVFSEAKLKSINDFYWWKLLSPEERVAQTTEYLKRVERENPSQFTVKSEELEDRPGQWGYILRNETARGSTVAESIESVDFFGSRWGQEYAANLLVWKRSDTPKTTQVLKMLYEELANISTSDFNKIYLESTLLNWIDEQGLDRGEVLWPMRVALTGREHSPGPFEVAAVLGKAETLRRLREAEKRLA